MTTSNKRHTVLVVDDDAAQVSLVEQILGQDPQLKIISSLSGDEAMRMAEMYAPSIILSDYFMPGMNGFELCKKVKEHPMLRDGMFILLTSATAVEDKVKGLENGADEFISKPVHPDELYARIRASVRIVQLQDELKNEKGKLAETNELLHESYRGMLDLLTVLVGLHVPDASKRSEMAIQIVQWLGEKLALPGDEIQLVCNAAALHEIGKISLPDDILKAEDQNFESKEHAHYPLAGERLMLKVPKLKDVAVIIRHQLENFDGSGFPDRLVGAEIPFGSRLLRAVNFLEHLGFHPSENSKIIDALYKVRGTILDPVIVQLLEEYLNVMGTADWMDGKRSIAVSDLHPGMILAADLSTGSGTKLLPKETVMTQFHINRILSHHQHDPIIGSIFIKNLN
jgi:putative two-component system response regulator